jgi:hypothetical protein
MVAALALGDMAAERGGAATLDGAHHFELAEAQMAGIGGAPGSAVATEDCPRPPALNGAWNGRVTPDLALCL